MAVNDALFGETARVHTLLKARGFDPKSGSRSGGIRDPRQVTIPPGAILLRTYQDPARLWGEWWFTAFEMAQVIAYFARDGSALAEGRPQGQGVLQATMAVRHEWGGRSRDHMALVAAVKTVGPLLALFGEGDSAPDSTQKHNLKPVQIQDFHGRRRGVRQIYLPEPGTYTSNFQVIEHEVPTDTDLIRMVRAYAHAGLPFEV